jgi:soluble lytic murein transglycosylase
VKSWIPKDGSVPLDIWVETIPFKETRDYVKNVMMYYQIYSLKMQKSQHIFEPLAEMRVGIEG